MSMPIPTDLERAIFFANRALDEPNADPDDDLRTVSRQFLRALEHRAAQPAGTPQDITLIQPDEMISWLTELNSNWSVCRNTRSFIEGEPSEYWKKFDAAMGKAFELQVALMKLRSKYRAAPSQSGTPEQVRTMVEETEADCACGNYNMNTVVELMEAMRCPK